MSREQHRDIHEEAFLIKTENSLEAQNRMREDFNASKEMFTFARLSTDEINQLINKNYMQQGFWKRSIYQFKRNKMAMFGLTILMILVLTAILTIVIDIVNPEFSVEFIKKKNLRLRCQAPSFEHIFGLDQFGRDIFFRIIWGIRYSLFFGVLAISISVLVGGTIGVLAGYFKKFDNLLMRLMDVLLAIPSMLLAIAIVASLGTNIINLLIAISIAYVPTFARVMRASVISIRSKEFVDAARTLGESDWNIIIKHIIPNSVTPVIVQATLAIAGAILSIAGMSFLGYGIQPPTPEWGSMLSDTRAYIRDYWHITTFPGLAIVVTILSLNLLGDGLRDAFDPKQSV